MAKWMYKITSPGVRPLVAPGVMSCHLLPENVGWHRVWRIELYEHDRYAHISCELPPCVPYDTVEEIAKDALDFVRRSAGRWDGFYTGWYDG